MTKLGLDVIPHTPLLAPAATLIICLDPGASQFGPTMPDAMLFEVVAIIPGQIDLIYQNSFGIIPIKLSIGLHLGLQITAFVVGIPTQVIDPTEAIAFTDPQFGSKLHPGFVLTPHNGTN